MIMAVIGMKQNKILITGFKSYKDKNSSEYLIDNVNADCDKFLFTNNLHYNNL